MAGRRVFVGAAAVALALLPGARGAAAQAPSADLSVTDATFSLSTVQPALVTGSVTVLNAGPSGVPDLMVVYHLPPGVGFVTGHVATRVICTSDPGTPDLVTCPLGDFGAATETSASLTVVNIGARAGTPLTVQATVSSAVPDPNPGNNTTSATFSFGAGPQPTVPGGGPSADLALGRAQPGRDGTELRFWFEAVNAGPSTAQDVAFRFTLPAGVRYMSATIAGHECTFDEAKRTGTCPEGAFDVIGITPAGFSVDIAGVPAGTRLRFTAELTSTTPDPLPGNNQRSFTWTVPGAPATTTAAPEALPATGGSTAWYVVLLGGAALFSGMVLMVLVGRSSRPPRQNGTSP